MGLLREVDLLIRLGLGVIDLHEVITDKKRKLIPSIAVIGRLSINRKPSPS